jgi:DNA repair protein RecO (recombination protein O)
MLRRTEGIVLKTLPLGEADLVVTFLTKEFGLVNAFAKSPRKIKSRFGSSLEPLTFSRISFWGKEDAALPRLTQSDILESFQSLRNCLSLFLKASEIIELTLHFIPERDSSKRICSLLFDTLKSMESGFDAGILTLYYKLKILEASGYLPRLNGCGRCGKKGDCFFLSHGTILCGNCSKESESYFRLSQGAIRFYYTLLGWDLSKISRIKPSEALFSELSRVMDEHIRYISEKNPKTKSFRLPSAAK